MGLRYRLWLRSSGQSPGKVAAVLFGMVMMLVWGVMLGFSTASFLIDHPELEEKSIHGICLAIFLFQTILGLVTMAVADFFDVSRLFHLPVGYRETFAAMVAGGVLAPTMFIFAGPLTGATVALGGSELTIIWRLCVVLILFLLGHAMALVLNLVFLSMFTRRRLRDLAAIGASLMGMTFFVLWQSISGSGPGEAVALVHQYPIEALRWLPTGWVAELFLLTGGRVQIYTALALTFVFACVLLLLGARFLKASFLGQVANVSIAGIKDRDRSDRRSWLPADISALVALGRKIYWREPMMKAFWLQQTVFMAAPALFLQFKHGGGESGMAEGPMLLLLMFMLPMSHLHFLWSQFGVDGRGLRHTLLAPIPRHRIIMARGLMLTMTCAVLDFLLIAIVAVGSGFWHGMGLASFRPVPAVWVGVMLTNIALMAVGILVSVYLPMRLVTSGRRAIQGQRAENSGCSSQMLRLLCGLPAIILGSVLSVIALWPIKEVVLGRESDKLFAVDPMLAFLTIPACFAIVILIYIICARKAATVLFNREEDIVRALSDTGE